MHALCIMEEKTGQGREGMREGRVSSTEGKSPARMGPGPDRVFTAIKTSYFDDGPNEPSEGQLCNWLYKIYIMPSKTFTTTCYKFDDVVVEHTGLCQALP